MKCQEFDTIVVDLVRGEVTDSSLGTRCWAHAANCSRCANRLLEQEKLTAGFAALANRSEQMQAPDRIEAALRAAFHKPAATGLSIRPKAAFYAPQGLGLARNRMVWAMAAAAMLLASVAIVRARLWSSSTATWVARVQLAGDTDESIQPNPLRNSNQQRHASKSVVPTGHANSQSSGKAAGSAPPHKQASPGTNSKPRRRQAAPSYPTDEIATNFIPLPYGSGLTLDEGWEMVRVSLPRSALETLGAPWVNEQASAGMVQADVVLGQDGLARAIRFVQ